MYKYYYSYAFVWIFKIVSLFNYQGSFRFVAFFSKSASIFYHTILLLSRTFFKFFFCKINGETGIWTLAPVLPTYSLSRGAPSASWVFLQGLHINQLKRRRWDSNPRSLSGSPVFKTGSLNHSDTSPVTVINCDSSISLSHAYIIVNRYFKIFYL